MKIGIVSKPEHCKPHMKALMDRGHEVVCLGTDKVDFPPSYDVFVCRPESVSHQAFWEASEVRKNGRDVIFENSVTKIVKAVEKMEVEIRKEKDEYARDADMVAGVLRDALEPTALTVEKKLFAAVREIGIYHPRLIITPEQLQTLHQYGLIKSLPKAKEAYQLASMINPTSWPKPFNNIRRSPRVHTYRLWKTNETDGRMRMKTPWDMASPTTISPKTLEKVAKLFGFTVNEPDHGRVWPPNVGSYGTAPGVSEQIETNDQPLVESMLNQVALEGVHVGSESVNTSDLSTTGAKEVEKPKVSEPVVVPEIVAVFSGKDMAVIKSDPKADIKELLGMLNDALLALNIQTLVMRPAAEGPSYEMEQKVIRKVSSIEDLV